MAQLLQHLSSSHAIEMASALPCGKELTGAEFPRLRFVELPRAWAAIVFHAIQTGNRRPNEATDEETAKVGRRWHFIFVKDCLDPTKRRAKSMRSWVAFGIFPCKPATQPH